MIFDGKAKMHHNLHIHSKISICSDDPEQTNERICATQASRTS